MKLNKKTFVLRAISLLFVLLWMGVIFLMSAESGAESTDTSDGVVYYIAKVIVSGFDEMTILEQQLIMDKMSGAVRTAGHFCEFAGLGFLSLNALLTYKLKIWQKVVFSFVFSVIYAISDEIHQIFVPDRAFQISDIAVDSLGVLTGIAMLCLVLCIVKKCRKEKKNDT